MQNSLKQEKPGDSWVCIFHLFFGTLPFLGVGNILLLYKSLKETGYTMVNRYFLPRYGGNPSPLLIERREYSITIPGKKK